MSHTDYFEYLRRRSRYGLFYRHRYLYPRLSSRLRGSALDIGCGIGDMLRHRPETVGVDINPETVAWCREQGLDARVMEVDKLPFEAATFDSAILDNVLEHLTEPSALLDEIARVVRPGGSLIVGVPGTKGYTCDPDHKQFYDEDTLVDRVSQHGFASSEILHMPFRSTWLDRNFRAYCVYGVFHRD